MKLSRRFLHATFLRHPAEKETTDCADFTDRQAARAKSSKMPVFDPWLIIFSGTLQPRPRLRPARRLYCGRLFTN